MNIHVIIGLASMFKSWHWLSFHSHLAQAMDSRTNFSRWRKFKISGTGTSESAKNKAVKSIDVLIDGNRL